MEKNTFRAKNWFELEAQLFEGALNPALDRYRSPYAFRGVQDVSYRLETTLIRLGGDFAKMEHHLLRNFRKYAHRDVVERDSVWHWLAVAQHRGLPTRLLDWTYSPYVAMHFAVSHIDQFDRDGAVWMVNFKRTHQFLPPEYCAMLKKEGADLFTVSMLSEFVDSLADMDTRMKSDFALFLEPPSIDDRIINQYALFSVMSNPRLSMDDWLRDRPDLWRKIIIPAELKWEIRDKLDQANITERVLFPGLDGLSSWLKRQYSQKK